MTEYRKQRFHKEKEKALKELTKEVKVKTSLYINEKTLHRLQTYIVNQKKKLGRNYSMVQWVEEMAIKFLDNEDQKTKS